MTEQNQVLQIKNPDVKSLVWKPAMLERYTHWTDVALLQDYSTRYLRKAIRVNTLKITVEEVKKRLEKDWILEQVPWCPEGFWIEHRAGKRTDVGNLLEHALGYCYVQDPASMIPPMVLNPQPGDRVLDVCAAPGSKTTQIAAKLQNQGVLVANDLTHDRLASLGINLQRMGVTNVVMTQMRGQNLVGTYDKILLDAPCSATGTIRRSPVALKTWSIDGVRRVAEVQRDLLNAVWKLLAPGGTMVYSTCSLEPEENECMVDDFLRKHSDASVIPITLPMKSKGTVKEHNGVTFLPGVSGCMRIFPQDNDTEGFFVAHFRKN